MRLIGFAVVLALSLVLAPLAAEMQTAGKVYRIGLLSPGTADSTSPLLAAFRQGLRELGDVEGHNVALEGRYADGRPERLTGLAAELVRLKVDVIVATSNQAIAAARNATTSIPIVMTVATDPVAAGFVTSLARPGGNITGLTAQTPDVAGKTLQLLKEAIRKTFANCASQSRVPIFKTASKTRSKPAGARLITRRILPVAVCCSSAVLFCSSDLRQALL